MPVQLVSAFEYDHDLSETGSAAGKLTHSFGFDAAAKFLSMGVGTRRQFSTIGGDTKGLKVVLGVNCSFVVAPDLSLKIFKKTGLITIEGVSEGTTTLSLVDAKGKAVDTVTISVTKFRSVKVRFYNLVDASGSQGIPDVDTNPAFTKPKLDELIFSVNSIVGLQCDVMLGAAGQGLIRDLKFNLNFGGPIDITKLNPFFSPDLDPDAQYHVAFGRGIAGPHSNGITQSNFTVLLSSLPEDKRKITLAHEFVHFLSGSGIIKVTDHDDATSDLMFKTAPHGIMMRKARLQKIIH